MNKKGKRRRIVFVTAMAASLVVGGISAHAFEEEMDLTKESEQNETQENEKDGDLSIWTETYTYLSDTETPHANFTTIQKDGKNYKPGDVQYEVTPLERQLSLPSEDLWAYATYEPVSELEDGGLHYTLNEVSKEEWTNENRSQSVTRYQTYLEGQEIPESLEIEAQDEITGESIYGTIWQTDLWEDGADWKEGELEQWVEYSWDDDGWNLEFDGTKFYATSESPWFEGCEGILLRYLQFDESCNWIQSVEWDGDEWQNEDGSWGRSARITGSRLVPRYQVVYSGAVAEEDLPMVRYTAHYTSDPEAYLVSAKVTYQLEQKTEEISNSEQEKWIQQLEEWISRQEEITASAKVGYLILAVLAAVGVGLQAAVIFVLAFHKKEKN